MVAQLFPDAVISDRTAIENQAASDGSVCVISSKKRDVILPGVKIRPRKGAGKIKHDRDFIDGLTLASPARACLENLRNSRSKKDNIRRTLGPVGVEVYLEMLLRRGGEKELNKLRDEAKEIAFDLSAQKELVVLDQIVGTLLGTKAVMLHSPQAKARAQGEPYDAYRLQLFEALRKAIEDQAPRIRLATSMSAAKTVNLSFFEAYFSNFIEGTEFKVNEAEQIIFNNAIPTHRPKDAHDILSTFQLVSNTQIMSEAPQSKDHLIELLKRHHFVLMKARPEVAPGTFKEIANRAGNTYFVEPNLVVGTLRLGFDLLQTITTPFGRAVFMMFLISEVHPFLDGNGRTARIFMNIELVSKEEQRIIIPTIYRNNYISALKAVSNNHQTGALVSTLDFAQRYTQSIEWSERSEALIALQNTNAFQDSSEAESSGIRLMLLPR